MTCDGLTPALSVIPADRRALSNWYGFVGPLVLAAISNVKMAESSLSFNRSSCLLRCSLMIQSRSRELQHGSSLAGDQAKAENHKGRSYGVSNQAAISNYPEQGY
jgi:hypothetical protein